MEKTASDHAVDLSSSFNSNTDPKLSKKKFDYLYKRTCFRCMGEFYRHLFS